MEHKVFGENLAKLRKKAKLTQQELAEQIGFSNKTVSKWENAETLPEITILPKLAAIFGVSVDYLLLGERNSIAFAGDILVDRVNEIDHFPQLETLANIKKHTQSVGGCVPCTAVNLAKIDQTIPISVWGCVGDDAYGRYVSEVLRQYNINVSPITVLANSNTGFCEVMADPEGEKTYFYSKGANSLFGPEHIDLNQLQCNILHVGYLLLLDKFEEYDEEFGTKMARFLHSAQEKGIKVSIDIANKNTADWSRDVVSVLKYVNYLICNETQCCACFNLKAKNSDGTLNMFNIKSAMRQALKVGVKDKVIVHTRDASFVLNSQNEFTCVPSLDIPSKEIKNSTGAGDAFAAGCLYAINNNYNDKEILEFASCAGACNLFSENSIDGMKNKKQILSLMKEYKRKTIKF